MAKNQNGSDKFDKRGYQPLNEGYSPKEQRGHSPKPHTTQLPKAPQGGTGESSKPTNRPANTATESK